jgi:thiol-disulfide isomerase/thioredoxin
MTKAKRRTRTPTKKRSTGGVIKRTLTPYRRPKTRKIRGGKNTNTHHKTIQPPAEVINWETFEWSNPSAVKDLEEKTKGKTIYGKFWMPTCGYCNAMAEEWDKFKEAMKNHKDFYDVDIINHQVDASRDFLKKKAHKNVEIIEVNSFPTIYKIKNGEYKIHNGDRTVGGFMGWVKSG